MGKSDKKKKSSSRRRGRSRSRSRSASASSSSDSSRSRSRDRSSRKRKEQPVKHEKRSRSRSRDRKKSRRSPSASRSRSRSRTKRERSPKREVKHESAASAGPSASDLRRIKEEEKARLKASETPAEKAARRAAKKALKHGGGGEDAAADAGGKPFVWKKKFEKTIQEGLDPKILTRAELAAKQALLTEEIAAIKARKIARAEEKEQMDALRESMAREAEAENIEGWEEKEEEFHRQNAKLRTDIRIKEGREKLIDVLVKNRVLRAKLRAGATDEEREMHPEWAGAALDPNLPAAADLELTEPARMLTGGEIPWRDLEFLEKDIEHMVQLAVKEDAQYWASCAALCKEAIIKQKGAAFAAQCKPAAAAAASSSTTSSIKDDMHALLSGKSLGELDALERDIQSLLRGGPSSLPREGLDPSYWSELLVELRHARHQQYLREEHVALLEARLADLKKYCVAAETAHRARRDAERAARIERGDQPEEEQAEEPELDFEPQLIPHDEYAGGTAGDAMDTTGDGGAADDLGRQETGSFSPALEPDEDEGKPAAAAMRGIKAIDPEADARELAEQRALVAAQKQRELAERLKLATGSAVTVSLGAAAAASSSSAAADGNDAAYRRESGRGLESDEIQLKSEFAIPEQTYWWQDKFRPRKPRFFNRVKTGFEWNKYNTTHYDKENPPPKIVQGYKFNIFYPDLIDASVAPRYRIEPDPGGNPDFCILRFLAGPPYEDLAFKIVKKEWEYSFKRGYKCVFDRGVLALYFNFRRYFYRR